MRLEHGPEQINVHTLGHSPIENLRQVSANLILHKCQPVQIFGHR